VPTATRNRLLDALKAITRARPKISFRTAFLFLARFVQAFRDAAKALDAKQPQRGK
jgi:phage antirepressor YoqD-like protein